MMFVVTCWLFDAGYPYLVDMCMYCLSVCLSEAPIAIDGCAYVGTYMYVLNRLHLYVKVHGTSRYLRAIQFTI
jgi:hypothetical protein